MTPDYKTGDILLCDGTGKGFIGYFGNLIKYFTKSNLDYFGQVYI